jgi:hypothetical protein
MISISMDNVDDLMRRLNAAPREIQDKVLRSASLRVININKKRVDRQVDVDGRPFVPRVQPRQRKMLEKLAAKLKTVSIDADGAIIGFKNSTEGNIGAKQQFGFTERFSCIYIQVWGYKARGILQNNIININKNNRLITISGVASGHQ